MSRPHTLGARRTAMLFDDQLLQLSFDNVTSIDGVFDHEVDLRSY